MSLLTTAPPALKRRLMIRALGDRLLALIDQIEDAELRATDHADLHAMIEPLEAARARLAHELARRDLEHYREQRLDARTAADEFAKETP